MLFSYAVLAPVVGLSCFFGLEHGLCSMGWAFAGVTVPVVWILPAHLAGIVGGAAIARLCWRADRFSMHVAVLAAMALVGAGCFLVGGAERDPVARILFLLGTFCSSIPLPVLLHSFFRRTSESMLGVLLGSSMALGQIFWFFAFAKSALGVVFQPDCALAILTLGAGISAALLVHNSQEDHAAPPKEGAPWPEEDLGVSFSARTRSTLFFLVAVGGCFFLLNSMIDLLFFRYDSSDNPIPGEVSLYIWITYPLVGLLIDRQGAETSFFLTCLGLTILSPIISALSEGTVAYWLIFGLNLIGVHAGLLFLIIVFSKYAMRTRWPGFVTSVPYILMYASILSMRHFFEAVHPGRAFLILIALFLSAAFGHISLKVRHALALTGCGPRVQRCSAEVFSSPSMDVQAGDVSTRLADFAETYGLTPRETEVMDLLSKGAGTERILEVLCISESTAKTHIRRILHKTDMPNRSALVACFFQGACALSDFVRDDSRDAADA